MSHSLRRVSKGTYIFDHDVSFSENYEDLIIDHINSLKKYQAKKCNEDGFPDIQINNLQGNVYRYLEVKVQQRTFMKVEKYLPQSKLMPSETVALNLSDLLRYFKIEEATGVTTAIVWVLLNRACVVPANSFKLFFEQVTSLKKYTALKRATEPFDENHVKEMLLMGCIKVLQLIFILA